MSCKGISTPFILFLTFLQRFQPVDKYLLPNITLKKFNLIQLFEKIMVRAGTNLQHIVLPEGTEIRTLKSVDIILREKTAILSGDVVS